MGWSAAVLPPVDGVGSWVPHPVRNRVTIGRRDSAWACDDVFQVVRRTAASATQTRGNTPGPLLEAFETGFWGITTRRARGTSVPNPTSSCFPTRHPGRRCR